MEGESPEVPEQSGQTEALTPNMEKGYTRLAQAVLLIPNELRDHTLPQDRENFALFEQVRSDPNRFAGMVTDINAVMNERLTPDEHSLISEYYGLDGNGGVHDLRVMAARHNVTRERIRQRREKAMKKLRHANLTTPIGGIIADPSLLKSMKELERILDSLPARSEEGRPLDAYSHPEDALRVPDDDFHVDNLHEILTEDEEL